MPKAAKLYRESQTDPSKLLDEIEDLSNKLEDIYGWAYKFARANGATDKMLDALKDRRVPDVH